MSTIFSKLISIYLFLKKYTPIGNLWVGNETNYQRKSPLCLLHTYKICYFPGLKIWVCCIQKGKCFLKFLCIFCLSVSCKKCMKSTQGIFQGWLTYDGCSLDILSACDMVIWDALLEVLHIFCWLLWAKWGVGLKWAS